MVGAKEGNGDAQAVTFVTQEKSMRSDVGMESNSWTVSRSGYDTGCQRSRFPHLQTTIRGWIATRRKCRSSGVV